MFIAFKKELTQKDTVCFSVRVRPSAPKTCAVSVMDDASIKIDIAAVPEGGKANIELIKYIAKEFGVSRSQVAIISGAADRHKLIQVRS